VSRIVLFSDLAVDDVFHANGAGQYQKVSDRFGMEVTDMTYRAFTPNEAVMTAKVIPIKNTPNRPRTVYFGTLLLDDYFISFGLEYRKCGEWHGMLECESRQKPGTVVGFRHSDTVIPITRPAILGLTRRP
jgi:hypothetical protein